MIFDLLGALFASFQRKHSSPIEAEAEYINLPIFGIYRFL